MAESILNRILKGTSQLKLELVDSQLQKMAAYIKLMEKWNRTYNLTAIRDSELMVSYHLLDSLVLAHRIGVSEHDILDVGSGAGLPGIPLSILFPQKDFTLLDSNGKKTRFITQTKIELDLPNCRVVNQRVEDFQPEKPFDIVVSRAFSSIKDFVSSTGHLLKPQGSFYAMKGKCPDQELRELKESQELQKAPQNIQLHTVEQLQVPFLNKQRHLVILRKTY